MGMHVEKYYCQGFRMEVSPQKFADCDIYFRWAGHGPNVTGIDLYSKDRTYLGFVYPTNLDLPLKRAIREYLTNNKRNWVRVHGGV
jgi:hypothetical protein